MPLLGVLLILGSAVALSRGYGKYLKKRTSTLRSLIDLIRYLEGRMEGYLEPLAVALGKYTGTEELSELLLRLRRGESARTAYREVRGKLSVCPRADAVLLGLFDGLGGGKLGQELRQIRSALAELDRMYSEEKTETERSLRVFCALILAAALGLCIFMI